ncbi:lytic transglycosylase domain-containing protein [Massilia sp. H6]|uniref:lytic transglycosylase domain-containing protein n=1 Tax=Massilia sp. H6 TaxID=2970464 RepID=UPI00216739BD|nr:lytic transglycosylase domain-containing protein [Massilia sp. H6]UVW30098.1 lytic transglycosylase domain-containing protein [Massilia sp. H6]
MIHRFITGARLVQSMANQPVSWSSMGKAVRGAANAARNTMTVFGFSAVAMLGLLYTNDDLAKQVSDVLDPQPDVVAIAPAMPAPLAVAEVVAAEPAPVVTRQVAGDSKQQQFVTSWLSKRYRVASDAANMLVSTAYTTAHEVKLDPLLILAVMAIESGLNPFAESAMGAKGLMQVMAKVHHDKFEKVGGQKAALDPAANIRVGALILKDYVKRTGSVEGGLKTYVGAADMATDQGYGSKVLAEYHRLKQVARGHKVPTRTAPSSAPIVVKRAPAPAPAPVPEQAPAPTPAPAEGLTAETLATL